MTSPIFFTAPMQ